MTDPNTDRPITVLELPANVQWALHRAKIETINDLVSKTQEQILSVPRIGRASLKIIEESLKNRGLGLRIEETTPPQDGAPVTERPVDSVPQPKRYPTTHFFGVVPIFAVAVNPQTEAMHVWEIKSGKLITDCACDGSSALVATPWPRYVRDYIDRHGLEIDKSEVRILVRIRSFFGLVDELIPVVSFRIQPKDELFIKSVERTLGLNFV